MHDYLRNLRNILVAKHSEKLPRPAEHHSVHRLRCEHVEFVQQDSQHSNGGHCEVDLAQRLSTARIAQALTVILASPESCAGGLLFPMSTERVLQPHCISAFSASSASEQKPLLARDSRPGIRTARTRNLYRPPHIENFCHNAPPCYLSRGPRRSVLRLFFSEVRRGWRV